MAETQVPFISPSYIEGEGSIPQLPSYRSRSVSPVLHGEFMENGSRIDSASVAEIDSGARPKSRSDMPFKSSKSVVIASDVAHIEGWPTEPQTLKQGGFMSFLLSLGDCIIIIAPVYFIVLDVLAFRLHRQPTLYNSLGKTVEDMSKLAQSFAPYYSSPQQGPTIFPIVFTAVAGRSLKTVARFCAERGSKIGVLELLMASQTVWGTFESQFLLRRFTIIGSHLFILWSLSPLGGQASLRLLYIEISSVNSTSTIRYLPTYGMSLDQLDAGVFAGPDTNTGLAVTNSLYTAALLAPESIKLSSQDTWRNLKIPRLATVQNVTKASDGWATVPHLSSPANFTTLVGLPIAGSSTGSTSTKQFNLDYSYMDLECSPEWFISHPDGNWTQFLGAVWSPTNGSAVFYNNATQDQTSFFLDTNLSYDTDRVTPAFVDQNTSSSQDAALQARRNILFGSEYYRNSEAPEAIFYRNCTVWTEFLEAQVQCHSQDCEVTAVRPSVTFADRNENLTPLDLYLTCYYFFKDLPLATGSLHLADAAPSEMFIRGADMPYISDSSSISDISAVPADVFASRLALLMNTYYQIALSPLSFIGNLPDPDSDQWDVSYTSDWTIDARQSYTPFIPMNATAQVSVTAEVYACNFLWFALLMMSTSVLFFTGLIGTILKYKCLAPDIIGFVTSLTYDNPHVKLPPGGGVLSAMERARLLQDVEVKIGDADQDSDIGRVVFATSSGDTPIGRLQKSRTYL